MKGKRIAVVAVLTSVFGQMAVSLGPLTCPASVEPPCSYNEAIREAWGCGTYGNYCCYYVTYRCPGSPDTYTV